MSSQPRSSLRRRPRPHTSLKAYRLNTKDQKRFHALVVKEAIGRITAVEAVELEALTDKRRRRLESHPGVAAEIRASEDRLRRIQRLAARLSELLTRIQKADRQKASQARKDSSCVRPS